LCGIAADVPRRGRWRRWIPVVVHAVAVQAFVFALRPSVSYAALDAGVAPALLGLLSACYAFAPLLLALPAGRLVDRVGERPVLLVGGVALTASCVVLLIAPHVVGWLAASLVLAGVGHLLCMTGEQTSVAKMSSGRSDSRFGTYTFASSLGQAVGPLFLSLGSDAAVLMSALGVSAIVIVSGLAIESHPAPVDAESRANVLSLLRDRGIRGAIVVSGIVLAAVDITLVYLPALGQQAHFSVAFVGWVLAVRAVASMAVRLITGRAVAIVGRRALLLAGMSSSAAALVVTAAWPQQAVWVVAAAVLGAGLGVSQPITMSAVADHAPVERRGTAMTLRLISNRLSVVVLPGSIGMVAASAGAAGVLVATAVLLGGGCLVWARR
jgi:MFS family permease